MLVFIQHFVYNSTSYTTYFDTSNNTVTCDIVGLHPDQSTGGATIPVGEQKSFCSDNPSTTKVTTTVTGGYPYATFVLQENSPDCVYTPPSGGCDIAINSIAVTNEQSAGANDGSIVINASSSYGDLEYSINGSTFQSSNVFTDIAVGNYTAYVRDNNECDVSQPFSILAYSNPVQNFTNELPVVPIAGGNVSRWNAAFNPIVINYQRKDFAIVSISQLGSQIAVKTSVTLTSDQFNKGINDGVYFKSPKYEYYGNPVSYNPTDGFIFDYLYLGDDTEGYLNVNSIKPNFFVQTEITSGNNPIKKDVLVAEHSPNNDGHTRADLSPYLQSLLSPDETYNYLSPNYKDYNLGGSYTIRYREVWDGGNTEWFSAPYPLYYTYAAMQLGDKYGGNMAQYIPFLTVPNNSLKAKFLSGFDKPVFWSGLPFELSFIYSENIIDKQLYFELLPNCGDGSNGLLLNADATYLLNADNSRFIIERVYNPNIQGYPIIEALGVNRVLVPDVFDCCADVIKANIYYLNGENKVYIMQDLPIQLECPCEDPYVYIKWINKLGAWDYWRFGYNQGISNITSGSDQVERFVNDWQNDQTIEDFISRKSNDKLTLVAGQLNLQQLEALSWMGHSRRVQMLVSKNPVKWQTVIIPDGDFSKGSTKSKIGNVKLSITLPALNGQRG